MSPPSAPSLTVSPGTVAVYKDRTAWLAAVAAAGATAQEYNYTGLTSGRITARSVDYGPFRIAVDFLSTNMFNNPGIDSIPDASCTLGTGTCNRMIFNMLDPTYPQTFPFDQPKVDSLVMPQAIVAWAATFSQTGVAVGCGAACPAPTGPVTIHFGSAAFVLNDSLTNGFGFLGFIAGTPSTTISFTYAQGSGSTYANDLIEVYRPEFANGPSTPPPPTPSQLIATLRTYIAGAGLPKPLPTKLDASLQKALDALTANNTAGACANLQDVIDAVNKQSVRKVPASVATEIISETNAIRTAVGC
jgi:hypothetical protein